MFRLCASFAATGRGNERAALVAEKGLMKVDADEREAVSGRREVISAKEKRKFWEMHKQVRKWIAETLHVRRRGVGTAGGAGRLRQRHRRRRRQQRDLDATKGILISGEVTEAAGSFFATSTTFRTDKYQFS